MGPLSEKYCLRVLEERVLRRIFGPKERGCKNGMEKTA
jgi:hypothetical protein